MIPLQKQILPMEAMESGSPRPSCRLGMAAWVMAVGAAAMMVGLWLTAAFYACLVWKYEHFRDAVLPISVGEFIVNNKELFHREIHQSEMLLGWIWLAFVINAAANVFSQIPKHMSGRNQVLGRMADRISTWICLSWFVLIAICLVFSFV